MVGEKPPGCSDDEPHAKWLRDPVNQHLFECSKNSDDTMSKEDTFPSMREMTLTELRYLKAKAAEVDRFLVEDERDGALAAKMWPRVIRAACPSIPTHKSDLKGMLLLLVARCLRNRRTRRMVGSQMHQFLEGFAGKAMVTLHLLMHGYSGKRLDIEYSTGHDIINDFGTWLQAWTISCEGALHWTAPKCSSWVILCRGPSGRKSCNNFWGDESKAWVLQGNLIMLRTALLTLLSDLFGCHYVIEQPCNSVLFRAPPMSTVLRVTHSNKISTWHNAFGAESPKPFCLHSSLPLHCLVSGMKRKKLNQEGIKLVSKKGTKFSGNKNLTRSQAYTPAFGMAVAKMWNNFQRTAFLSLDCHLLSKVRSHTLSRAGFANTMSNKQ